jgi:hypothetical protein
MVNRLQNHNRKRSMAEVTITQALDELMQRTGATLDEMEEVLRAMKREMLAQELAQMSATAILRMLTRRKA